MLRRDRPRPRGATVASEFAKARTVIGDSRAAQTNRLVLRLPGGWPVRDALCRRLAARRNGPARSCLARCRLAQAHVASPDCGRSQFSSRTVVAVTSTRRQFRVIPQRERCRLRRCWSWQRRDDSQNAGDSVTAFMHGNEPDELPNWRTRFVGDVDRHIEFFSRQTVGRGHNAVASSRIERGSASDANSTISPTISSAVQPVSCSQPALKNNTRATLRPKIPASSPISATSPAESFSCRCVHASGVLCLWWMRLASVTGGTDARRVGHVAVA